METKLSGRLAIVEQDDWLKPVEGAMTERYAHFCRRLSGIERTAGSLVDYANGYLYFGFQYDPVRRGGGSASGCRVPLMSTCSGISTAGSVRNCRCEGVPEVCGRFFCPMNRLRGDWCTVLGSRYWSTAGMAGSSGRAEQGFFGTTVGACRTVRLERRPLRYLFAGQPLYL